MPQRVFVDTNCFLHLRDLKDLPWREVLSELDALEILVAPIVVDELDRLKTEKGGRTRNRCRAALDLIEQASASEGMRLDLRLKPFRISLVVAEAHRIDWAAYPRLDPTRPDDHLIAAALSEPGEILPTLVSFDTGPLIRARAVKLPAVRSPESWALPATQDETEQKLARLERDLAAAKSTRPLVTARFLDQALDGVVCLMIPDLEPISEAQQKRMLDLVKQRFPRKHVEATSRGQFDIGIYGIRPHQIDDYYRKYEAFLDASRRQFADLHLLMAEALRFGEVRFELHNDSPVTAANIRVAMACSDNFRMFGARSEMERYGGALKRIHRPDPPQEYPAIPSLSQQLQHLREPRRDPTGFYWLDRPVGGEMASLVCEELRATNRYEGHYYIAGGPPREGVVSVEVGATNLPNPVRIEAPIIIQVGAGSWSDPAVVRRLPEWIASVVASSE